MIAPVMASMAIPGVFPAVKYQDTMLVDGGVMCNFPLEYARKSYPDLEVIGVYLGQFKKHQPIKSMIDTLLLSYEVSMQAHLLKDLDKADYLFKRDLEVALLETSEEKIRKIFELGYQDGMQCFA
ncbi:MAG: patatin-like phospholipase family protein [bacterium]|nr:patatin-like phospholipase family protein [bacterium]